MKKASLAITIALCLATVTAAPSAAAQSNCQQPADGFEVCDNDEDPEPERIYIEHAEEGVGTLTINYEEGSSFFSKHRKASVKADTAETSPVGEKHADADARCTYGNSEVPGAGVQFPCTAVSTGTEARESFDQRVLAGASCEGLTTGELPTCTTASASADAIYGDNGVGVVVLCGSFGFFQSTPCPLDVSAGASAFTVVGDASAFAGATPMEPSAFVCEDDPASGSQCAP